MLDRKVEPSSVTSSGKMILVKQQRLVQTCVIASVSLFIALLFARGLAVYIFSFGLLSLVATTCLSVWRYSNLCNYLFLISISLMLLLLSITGAGVFDLAMLGYPSVIIFSAILGDRRLFLTTLTSVLLQCVLLAWLAIEGVVVPHAPSVTWSHVIFIMILFIFTGFCVYILVQDIRNLLQSLQIENTKAEESRLQVQHLALHDPLTDLPNRLCGERLFSTMLEKNNPSQTKLALLFIDLDNFKPINDALGHAAGDKFLQNIAQTISQHLNGDQCLIRFGGDEFIVLAAGITDKNQVDALCTNLIAWCSTEFEVLEAKIVVSASIGVACAPDDGTTFKQLCRKADVAMYESKRKGRNRFEYYNAALDERSDVLFNLLQQLRPAVLHNKLAVYYQPLIALETGKVCAMEALVRWPQEDGSLIFPDQFIPVAESSGLINKLGAFVLTEACEYCAYQHSIGNKYLSVAVNLSFSQFRDNSLPGIVKSALQKSGLPAASLELELTESILADDHGNIRKQLEHIKQLGVQFSIDDFGTGYSNLNYLRAFNAGKLKIDKIFITTLGIDQKHETLVSAIINMAKSLDMQVVAEGVENEAAKAKLIELGCDIGQGYLWSKPIPKHEFDVLLRAEQHIA